MYRIRFRFDTFWEYATKDQFDSQASKTPAEFADLGPAKVAARELSTHAGVDMTKVVKEETVVVFKKGKEQADAQTVKPAAGAGHGKKMMERSL